jgi:signal transduction histidine kinase
MITYEADTLPDRVRRNGVVDRVDDYTREFDAELAAQFNMTAAVSVPIFVGGRVWGMLTATSSTDPLADGTEERLLQFAGLVTAALASIQTRSELRSLADEQAALRSIAVLAARDAPVEQVLQAVAGHASQLAGVDCSSLLRYEPDGSTEIVALADAPPYLTIGMCSSPNGDGAAQRVWRTHEPARVDDLATASGHWPQIAHEHGFCASAAVPILVHGTLWGALVVVSRDDQLLEEIHTHLTNFAELTGTALSSAQARRELQELADEQGALRRVAELVARGTSLADVFKAIAEEASHLLGNLAAALLRYESEDVAIVIAECNSPIAVGLRIPATPGTPTGEVLRARKPFRMDHVMGTGIAGMAADFDVASSVVSVPITVEGSVWGAVNGRSVGSPLTPGTEDRLTRFAELAAAAIANAQNKEKLTASRARVVATADETRRKLQRDVHDGAQQRLIHAIITLKLARDALAAGRPVGKLVEEALANAQRANSDLRSIVHGILPAALTRGGLHSGLESLVADFSLPVRLHVAVPRLPTEVETTAYFIVAEALTNVVKHACATKAAVSVTTSVQLEIQVSDDGTGGADPKHGSGLTGLLDRVEANNGTLTITSPLGEGTTLRAQLPLIPPSQAAAL